MSRKRVLNTEERSKIHKANKFYDKYMAGKWNPEEGEYNFNLNKQENKSSGGSFNYLFCKNCGSEIRGKNNTSSFICSKCNSFNSVV